LMQMRAPTCTHNAHTYLHADDGVEGREHVCVAEVGTHVWKRNRPLKLGLCHTLDTR
jgi:hypothetical protein